MNAKSTAGAAGAGVIALALLLTGCASSQSSHSSGASSSPASSPRASSAGAGSASAAAPSMAAAAQQDTAPSATAKMVCGDDIRGQVSKVLKLGAAPVTRSSWANQLYTCTYSLPMGPMVLSVKQSASRAEAAKYFAGLRPSVGHTESSPGLGEQAYSTGTGIVVVIKDNMTLEVNTTKLPAVFGSDGQRRSDLAYEVASDVLGCWTGDE